MKMRKKEEKMLAQANIENNNDHIADAGHVSTEEGAGRNEGTQLQEDGNTGDSGNREEEVRTSVQAVNQNIQVTT